MGMRGREVLRPLSELPLHACHPVNALPVPRVGQAAGRPGCVGEVVLGSSPGARPAAGQAERSLPTPPLKYL